MDTIGLERTEDTPAAAPLRPAPHCCILECDNEAVWEIRFGGSPDDYTHSCDEHRTDDRHGVDWPAVAIYPIEGEWRGGFPLGAAPIIPGTLVPIV